jgi:polyisoprenyl-phosphate glycosyltransferase
MNKPELSIIVPMYNEASCIDRFFDEIISVLEKVNLSYEILCINDGGTDNTLDLLIKHSEKNSSIKIIDLSKNFGKEAALTAGLDCCRGKAVIPIDADLQDPPELIPDLVAKWKEGFEVVCAIRKSRDSDSIIKRYTADKFYRTFNQLTRDNIPHNAGDFRLISEKVVVALRKLPERNRFMKGLFSWVGYRTAFVEYDREERVSGDTKWSYWRLWNFALDGITTFSSIPLRIWTYIGALISLLSFLYAITLIFYVLVSGRDVPGYASLMVVILFFGGIQLLSLGIIGEYIGRIFQEVKGRPLYLINQKYGFDEE